MIITNLKFVMAHFTHTITRRPTQIKALEIRITALPAQVVFSDKRHADNRLKPRYYQF